jgi:hypothetical protein
MGSRLRYFIVFLALCEPDAAALATVLVDDTWADGAHDCQNPPAGSAWFAADAASLVVTPGSLTGNPGSKPSLLRIDLTRNGNEYLSYVTVTSRIVGPALDISVIYDDDGDQLNDFDTFAAHSKGFAESQRP